MPVCKFRFGYDVIGEVASIEELENFLIKLRKAPISRNPIVEMAHENSNILYLAFSSDGCHLDYIGSPAKPPYYSSLGDRTMSLEDGIVVFFMGPNEHETEIKKRNLITFEDVLRVTKAFFVSGERPANVISWEMD